MNSFGSNDSSSDVLFGLLEDWRALTLAETTSIDSCDWDGLAELHSKKLELQSLIEQAETKFFNNENITPERKSTEKKRLREFAAELLGLEEKNRATLAEGMALADSQLKVSNKSIRSLRNVQQAYGGADRSFWQAYS